MFQFFFRTHTVTHDYTSPRSGVRAHWATLQGITAATLQPWEQAVTSAASGGAAGEGVAAVASGAGAGGGESTEVSTEDAHLEELLLNPYPSEV